jgi:hypothetical protein
MRRTGAIAACLGMTLLAAACNTVDGTYLRDGVGTEVAATDIVAATTVQQIYFGEVCRQAGLGVVPQPDGVLLCDEPTMSQGAWTIFVQAGLNDIDRRCDAYLAWLDDRRRWREPILKQIHSTAAVTAAIMGLTGVGAAPIAIVGTAFGFAQETFVNLSGRLVTEVNHSTVQALVLTRQNEYRDGLRNRLIPNRPAAMYALRSYLRLCMPMTIETEINTTITSVERNNMRPGRMITPQTIAAAVVTNARKPLPSDFRPAKEDTKQQLNALLDQSLCITQTGKTQSVAVKEYLAGVGLIGDPAKTTTLPDGYERWLDAARSFVPNCRLAGYLTAFEVGLYGATSSPERAARIDSLKTELKSLLKKDVPTSNSLKDLRGLVREARGVLKLPDSPSGEIDFTFRDRLFTPR